MINEGLKPCQGLTEVGGFTLIELVLALALSSIVGISIYTAYVSQQRTYVAQEQVAEMQQNIRAAIFTMAGEIRMAGYDPNKSVGKPALTGITVAGKGQMSFTLDANGDRDFNDDGEMIDFGFSDAAGSDVDRDGTPDIDADGDGNPDVSLPLGRQVGGAGGYQAIAENIERIEFLYFNINGQQTNDLGAITSVGISILARSGRPDPDFTNAGTTFTAASGDVWGPYNDNFRRRLLVTRLECRNITGNL
ncbi:MAG: prepilin-type N-terminal cleavage/methylation domain-containing protein [Desulforhopalus sp.]|nr:prepilin-type N-terminal cleavage/methylation domain-containing protein [Desulforhopalus sp.]